MQLKIFKRYENYGHTLDLTNSIDFFSMRKAVCRLTLYVRTYMNR